MRGLGDDVDGGFVEGKIVDMLLLGGLLCVSLFFLNEDFIVVIGWGEDVVVFWVCLGDVLDSVFVFGVGLVVSLWCYEIVNLENSML